MSTQPSTYDLAFPDFNDKDSLELARVAVEFDHQVRLRESEAFLKGDPPSRIYWTVKLGRLALRRDGSWAYLTNAKHAENAEDRCFVQMQRFVDFEEAVRVATKFFGKEPEHAGWMRALFKDHSSG